MKPVVLVHGSHCGGWAWDRVTPLLDAAGVAWVAPDLPSVALGTSGVGHIEDAATVEAVLDGLPGRESAVLVGHSRGGGVISNAGTHARVAHLVYVTAVLLEEGEPSPASEAWRARLIQNTDGSSTIDPVGSAELALNDCSSGDVAWYMNGLRPQHAGPLPEGRYAWRSKPSTYAVCTLDAVILPERQRLMAQRATRMVEWETGHCPMVSRPDLVAELLIALASE